MSKILTPFEIKQKIDEIAADILKDRDVLNDGVFNGTALLESINQRENQIKALEMAREDALRAKMPTKVMSDDELAVLEAARKDYHNKRREQDGK